MFSSCINDKHTHHIKIINASERRIRWAIKTTSMKRLAVDRACGVLDPKEATLMAVSLMCSTANLELSGSSLTPQILNIGSEVPESESADPI
ncbi:hypothetical protein TELCIR_07553 [Teladorsagia circumcincta]|uniref:MSP domain-containing protein n=1 Tax=Teladorsagia circumcincta TaxID=45464 RepID=A0A2G9UK34_TELCI|nr:hypothetical protein TELCIR_07553 [Teladorsagia circumcincta]